MGAGFEWRRFNLGVGEPVFFVEEVEGAVEPAVHGDLFTGLGKRRIEPGDLVVPVFMADTPVVAHGAFFVDAEHVAQVAAPPKSTVRILRPARGLGEPRIEGVDEPVLEQCVGAGDSTMPLSRNSCTRRF